MDLLIHSRPQRLPLAVGCMLGVTLSSPGIALADAHSEPVAQSDAAAPEDGRALARRRVAEGQALYEQAKYEEALVAFQDAAAAYASPDFQFNIGLCYERLGETRAAIRAFEAYLRNKPDARDRASVEHRIEELRAEQDRETSPAVPTPVLVEPPGQAEPASTAPAPNEDAAPEARPHRPFIISGAALAGVGAAVMIAGGVGFGIVANRRADRVSQVLDSDNPQGLTRAETVGLAQEADRLRALQIGSIAGGGAMAIVGAALLTTGIRRRRQSQLTLLPTGRGLAVRGVF